MKTFQGTIRCCCAHAKINNNHQPPPPPTPLLVPIQMPDSPPPSPQQLQQNQHTLVDHTNKFASQCPYASSEYCNVLLECNKLTSKICEINSMNANASGKTVVTNTISPHSNASSQKRKIKPTISINVTDAENLNVCMCSLYASCDNVLVEQESMIGTICPRCQNIIKQQPTEHRKTLISKRLTLSKDIIVNRVDTHFLSLKTAFDSGKRYEPYTPESIESHSPPLREPDILEYETTDDNKIDSNNTISTIDENVDSCDVNNKVISPVRSLSTHSCAVSPRQLKSRLEILRKTSTDTSGMVISNHITENRKQRLKRGICFNKCCVII